MIGIYKITNPNGRIYIGQSNNIKKRLNHYYYLNCKNQTKLYNSLLKHGVDKHKFEVVIECLESELNELERYYQELYNCVSRNGLNCKLVECNSDIARYSEESKKKMSESAKIKIFTKEHRQNMSKNRIGNKNAMFGKKQSEETKIKIGISNKNKGIETRLKQSESAKKRPESFYENLSQKLKGNLPPNCKVVLNLETGIFYESIAEASRTFPNGKGSKTLACKLSGKRRNNTNFIYA